jgi:hypothetical protein
MMEPGEVERHRRNIAAMARQADDPEGFAQLVDLAAELAELLTDRAQLLREDDGYSWADLARPLGVTRGAAAQRFGRRPARGREAASAS